MSKQILFRRTLNFKDKTGNYSRHFASMESCVNGDKKQKFLAVDVSKGEERTNL